MIISHRLTNNMSGCKNTNISHKSAGQQPTMVELEQQLVAAQQRKAEEARAREHEAWEWWLGLQYMGLGSSHHATSI
jgi:hypothetical protein